MEKETLWSVPDFYTVGMTNQCNARCKHCYWEDEKPWMLSFPDVEIALAQISSVHTAAGKEKVKVLLSGGECTLWRDKTYTMDFGDLLVYEQEHGITPRFFTNGRNFRNAKSIEKIFGKFFARYHDGRVKVNMSVDTFHENVTGERCETLDNLLGYRGSDRRIDIEAVSIVTLSPERMIPQAMIERYQKQGVVWRVDAVVGWGDGVLSQDTPQLRIQGCDKQGLGIFDQLFYEKLRAKGIVSSQQQYKQMPNREIIRRLNFCGNTPSATILWKGNYYYCIPQSIAGNDAFIVAPMGALSTEKVLAFQQRMPLLQDIRTDGMVEVADRLRTQLDEGSEEQVKRLIDDASDSPKYLNCSMCVQLCKKGLWNKLNGCPRTPP